MAQSVNSRDSKETCETCLWATIKANKASRRSTTSGEHIWSFSYVFILAFETKGRAPCSQRQTYFNVVRKVLEILRQ